MVGLLCDACGVPWFVNSFFLHCVILTLQK